MAEESSPYGMVKGLPVPKFVIQEEIDKLENLELYPDDVWIVTYPKCGTTWMQQIVRLIHNNGKQSDDEKITNAVPWLEALSRFTEVNLDKLARPRAFKSHFPYALLPCGSPDANPCKYIYVARNPKDVAVSLYFHTKSAFFPDLEWDQFWDNFVQGKLEFGNYLDHLLSWWPHRNDKNVLFMKYEDMKKDLTSSIATIASFLGRNMSSEDIKRVAEMTDFKEMKENNSVNYSWSELFPSRNFMRKGTVGDWKNHLSAEQSAQIDCLYDEKLRDIGLEFDYE